MNNEMLCPLCKTVLTKGKPIRYETLDEHVCNPNGTSPVRHTLICSNSECDTHTNKTFWGDDGEGPYNNNTRKHKWINGNSSPFNSYHRSSHFQISYHEEDRKLKLGKLTIRREVKYKSDDYGHKNGKQVRYTTWWNNTRYTLGLTMFIFSVKQFYRLKKINKSMGLNEVKAIRKRAKWPRAEWWRKATVLWIRVFHPAVYKESTS